MLVFKNFSQFTKHFHSELACATFLEEQRWEGKPECPHCGSEHHSRTKTRFKHLELKDYKDFRCKACDKKYTVITGTVYENSKVSLRIWLQAMYLVSAHKKGISSLQLGRDLGVTQKTAWFMLHRIRDCFGHDTIELFGVCGEPVEVDETIAGGKTQNKPRSYRSKVKEGKLDPMANKSIVMGIVQRNGNLVLQPVSSRNQVLPNVLEKISPNASLITDSSGIYKGIDKIYKKHQVIDHSNDEYARGIFHTNTIEGAFSLFDRMVVGIYHYISQKHIQRYCNEFSFRYNTRKELDAERFVKAIKKVSGRRLKYKDLTS